MDIGQRKGILVIKNIVVLISLSNFVYAEQVSSEAEENEISTITVSAQRVAITRPASSYPAIPTVLRYDPQIDLQSRGLPEGQADISIRGGLFENTGIKIGAVTIFDPQTGHYTAGVPIDPTMLSAPKILTGIENSLAGFNSAVATIDYEIADVIEGGELLLGIGSDNLWYQNIQFGQAMTLRDGSELGASLSYASSQGDGSQPNGDHDFDRIALHIQRRSTAGQTDAIVSYQDKFYGWPGAYTGFPTLAETDHTKTRLLLLNHRHTESDTGWWEVGAYYRQLVDDYDFDRTTSESGVPGSFDHETRSYAIGFQGMRTAGSAEWRYGGQLTGDHLVHSTDLTSGSFDQRRYATFSLVRSKSHKLVGNKVLETRIGMTLDASNRDSNVALPLLGVSVEHQDSNGITRYRVDYSGASQVPGYTVLNSRPTGLFGGNPTLGRERSDSLAISVERETSGWWAEATLFHRQDRNLVDWTYLAGAPFARQANAVDIDVTGVEAVFARRWSTLELISGYTFLQKDADYGAADVDASYYALNYAHHRVTLALRYHPNQSIDIRFDNEFRQQINNPLRNSSDSAYIASLAIGWNLPQLGGVRLELVVDNLTDSDFEEFPGTLPSRRQFSVSAYFAW